MSQTGAGVWTLQPDALHKYGYDDIDKVMVTEKCCNVQQCVVVCCSGFCVAVSKCMSTCDAVCCGYDDVEKVTQREREREREGEKGREMPTRCPAERRL